MTTEKTALRKQLIQKIADLPADYIEASNKGIFDMMLSLPEFLKAKTIFSFYSLNREPDTVRFMEYALELGKTVALPVCFKGGIMEARAIKSFAELTESRYHLLEPLSSTEVIQPDVLDFIVVPALAYDAQGFRLGWGGGYYDRFLLKTQGFTAGITREALLCDVLPREKHDVAVDCIVTEKKTRPLVRGLV